jgi:hypothetical protein
VTAKGAFSLVNYISDISAQRSAKTSHPPQCAAATRAQPAHDVHTTDFSTLFSFDSTIFLNIRGTRV